MGSIFIVSLLFAGVSFLVSWRLKAKVAEYSAIPLRSGLTGKEVAEKMLQQSGIFDVQVISVAGHLSDHYNPTERIVNLSYDVYNGNSIAAAAIAAHECGHAVQHATAYNWLTLRSQLVPVVQFSSNIIQWVLLAGIIMINTFPGLLLAGIILFALTTFFAFITLPVELDASKRALVWLQKSQILRLQENEKAKDALKWAASTYVVAALASLATLIQYVLIFLSGSRNDDR